MQNGTCLYYISVTSSKQNVGYYSCRLCDVTAYLLIFYNCSFGCRLIYSVPSVLVNKNELLPSSSHKHQDRNLDRSKPMLSYKQQKTNRVAAQDK